MVHKYLLDILLNYTNRRIKMTTKKISSFFANSLDKTVFLKVDYIVLFVHNNKHPAAKKVGRMFG